MGTSTSPRPVICSTAEIIPIANSAWPATSARFTDSLMVLAQVALYVRLVSHLLDERRVESLGGGDAADLEQMMHRDHFRDHGDVLARIEQDRDARNWHAENVGRLVVEAGALGLDDETTDILGVPIPR